MIGFAKSFLLASAVAASLGCQHSTRILAKQECMSDEQNYFLWDHLPDHSDEPKLAVEQAMAWDAMIRSVAVCRDVAAKL